MQPSDSYQAETTFEYFDLLHNREHEIYFEFGYFFLLPLF